jgi:PAP2 superfamily
MSVVEEDASAPDEPSRAAVVVPLHRRLPGGRTLRDGHRLYWWGELLAVLIFYGVYSFVRNLHHGNEAQAYQHAKDLIDVQKALGINHEQAIQAWALGSRAFIIAANYFYGSLHFIVTAGVMIYLYRRWTDDYPRWRNTLGIATGLALIGFAFFPLLPPRLLDSYSQVHHLGIHYGFVDTLAKDPAFWSFNSGAVNKISNQFAAMPSVHCAWALWCACALVPRLKHVWAKVLAAIYPAMTVTVIVVTANHYFLDAVGGFFVFGVGYVLARIFTRAGRGPVLAPARAPAHGAAAT